MNLKMGSERLTNFHKLGKVDASFAGYQCNFTENQVRFLHKIILKPKSFHFSDFRQVLSRVSPETDPIDSWYNLEGELNKDTQ